MDEPEARMAVGDLFLLSVGTGISGGDAVCYFGIRYVDSGGIERSQFIFPHNGALSEGYELRSGTPVNMYNEFKHIEEGDERAVTLLPVNANSGYIFEIRTDDIAAAAATADITMTLTYVDTVGEEKICAPISAKEVVRNFYGYRPGSTGEIAYYAGTAAGGLMGISGARLQGLLPPVSSVLPP